MCDCVECGSCYGIFMYDFCEGSVDWIYKKISTEKICLEKLFFDEIVKVMLVCMGMCVLF